MDTKLISEIIRMAENADITSLEVSEGNLRIKVDKSVFSSSQSSNNVPADNSCKVEKAIINVAEGKEDSVKKDTSGLHDVKAPMLGVFYEAASPESKPFVSSGDKVKKGDVLCIIEAMKLMNEISSEREGIIEEVCVENGQVVEFGQTLFRIR